MNEKAKKLQKIEIFLPFACTVFFFDIPLHHQTRRDHILVEKQLLERWQSGRLHRSWKPTYWKVPGVRIPLSPQKRKLKSFLFFTLEGMRTPKRGFVIDEVACQSKNPSLSAEKEAERLPFFTLEGMRTPERGFVIDEVACQSKNRLTCKSWGAMQKVWLIYKGRTLNPQHLLAAL